VGSGLRKFRQTLSRLSKIALDSSCFIYHIEENQKYAELTKIIFEELLPQNKLKAFASTLIITEILTKPYLYNRPDLVHDYKDLILNLPNFSTFAPEEQICDGAALIRAKYNFRTPDAIHIATAIAQKAAAIVGNDKKWEKVKEIKTIILEEFI